MKNFIKKFDITAICETKLDITTTEASLEIDDYHCSRGDRNCHGGGVMLYTHLSLKPVIMEATQSKYRNQGMEILITRTTFSKTIIIVIAAYRPPSSKAAWFDLFREVILEVVNQGKLIILGDFNCDLLRLDLCQTQHLIRLLQLSNSGLDSSKLQPTRVTPTTSSCLDFISSDRSIGVKNYEVLDTIFSDHFPVTACITCPERSELTPILRRSFKGVDMNDLERKVAEIKITLGNDSNNVDSTLQNWYSEIFQVIDRVAPLKEFPRKKNESFRVDPDTNKLMRQRDAVARRLKKDQTNEDLHSDLRTLRKIIKSRLRGTFKKHAVEALGGGHTRDAWRFIREATFTVSKGSGSLPDINELNEFFASTVSISPAHTINLESIPSHPEDDIQNHDQFSIQAVSRQQVEWLLSHVDYNTSSGPDDLPAFLLRKLCYAIAPNITLLFNYSISECMFPSVWKQANITAVYKRKGAKLDVDSYRPISILPILGRLLEKVVAGQLQKFCDSKGIIPDQQFGFRKHSSCELALLAAMDKWLQQMDSGFYVGALMIDLSKAFDSISHEQLVVELRRIGCDVDAARWFTSYLHERQQRVRIGSRTAPWRVVTKGVPQGSSLSPLLFNIFVRTLPEASGSDCFQFADDLTNSVADKDPAALSQKLVTVFENVKQFCDAHNLQINIKKTQLLILKSCHKRKPENFSIDIEGVKILPVTEVKILGVTLDQHLTMSRHIDDVVTKCHGLLGVLRRAAKVLPRDLLRLTYISLIRSHMEYCSSTFISAAPSHLVKLDVVQKMASRIITNSLPRTHSAPLQLALGLNPLAERRMDHLRTIVENICTNKTHPFFKNNFFVSNPDVRPVQSRMESKRFSSFGRTYFDEYENRFTCLRDLQSLSMGRPTCLISYEQSAFAHSYSCNCMATTSSAPTIFFNGTLENEAPSVVALKDDGG